VIDPHSVGEADWARLYLLLTALEGAVEDAAWMPRTALADLCLEHAAVLGWDGSAPDLTEGQLLRRELRYGRRLLDGLYAGRPLDAHLLRRGERLCATLGCGNDALIRYCLSCGARRARLAASEG
jgi:hypothetical protein